MINTVESIHSRTDQTKEFVNSNMHYVKICHQRGKKWKGMKKNYEIRGASSKEKMHESFPCKRVYMKIRIEVLY
jgi:hypothetical protein